MRHRHRRPAGQREPHPRPGCVGTHSVIVPVSFGVFTGVLTDAKGNVVASFTEPATFRGSSARSAGSSPLTCSYTFSNTFVSDGSRGLTAGATYTFTGSGTVTGFIAGSK